MKSIFVLSDGFREPLETIAPFKKKFLIFFRKNKRNELTPPAMDLKKWALSTALSLAKS